MKKELPLVSVVITSYNRACWIKQAIESALGQDYPNLEIIISDNASTDNSEAVIQSYCGDSRIRYSRNETNIGMIPNFRKAFFEIAKGDYIINISSDDYLTDNQFISSAVNIINSSENILVVLGKYYTYFENNKTRSLSPVPFYYTQENRKGLDVFFDFPAYPYFGWAGCLLHRKQLSQPGIGIGESYTADIEANLKIFLLGNVGFVNREVYAVRYHGYNETCKERTAKEVIIWRLKMFDNIAKMYITIYGNDEKIKQWRFTLLYRDIKNILINFLLKNNTIEYNELTAYLTIHENDIYQSVIKKDMKYRFVKSVLLPVAKNNYLNSFGRYIFPKRNVFKVFRNK